eukprot:9484553-Pyramimonas_sp.AAC.1
MALRRPKKAQDVRRRLQEDRPEGPREPRIAPFPFRNARILSIFALGACAVPPRLLAKRPPRSP